MIDYFMKRPDELFSGADVVKILNHKEHGLSLGMLNSVQKANIERLIKATEKVTRMPFVMFCDGSRKREHVMVRHICMWFMVVKLQISLTTVGKMYGMDHSSVIHARENVSSWLLMRTMKHENELIDKIWEEYNNEQTK